MTSPQLLDYIRQQLAAGITRDIIKQNLAAQRWNEQDVNEAFTSVTSGVAAAAVLQPLHATTVWRRFWNFVLDIIFQYIISLIIGFCYGFAVVRSGGSVSIAISFTLGLASYFVYYIFFESIWQRTPSKWITKTKVVKINGSKPDVLSIVGRTLCRCIPFEAFTFLFGSYPYGWHDRFSKTMVVPDTYTVAEAASVNPNDKGKSHSGIIILGILILLMIPAVGIISSITLVALNDARQKGADAGIKSEMQILIVRSVLYQTDHNSYQGFCGSSQAVSEMQAASQLGALTPSAYVCNDNQTHWAASVPLRSAGYWCIDDSGNPAASITTALTTQTSCSGSI